MIEPADLVARGLGSNIPLLAVAYGTAAAASFLVNVAVGRSLGAGALGDVALAIAISRIFFAGTDLGLGTHLTRVVTRDLAVGGAVTSRFASFRVVAIIAGVAVTAAIGAAQGHGVLLFAAVAFGQGVIALQGLWEGLLLAHERQRAVAALAVAGASCMAACCSSWWLLGGDLSAFGLSYAVAAIFALGGWMAWTTRALGVHARWTLDRSALAVDLRRSWPIGISMLLGIAALRAPIVVVGMFQSRDEVGAFSAVDMFVTAGAILQAAVTNATYPRLAATFRTEPAQFRSLFWKSNALLAVVGLAIGGALVGFGGDVIARVFPSKDFAQTQILMPIMGWSTPALLLVHHNILIFAAADNERANLRLMGAWLASIVIFQLALVPGHGLVGAAWGVLFGRTVGLVALAIAVVAGAVHRGEPRS